MEVHHHPDLHHKKKNFKEYFLEFLMIFIAVTMGFFAESLREQVVNHEKEKVYMEGMIHDLERDTARAAQTMAFKGVLFKKIDSILKIPVENLKDINIQDSFYHYFVYFYSWLSPFNRVDNTISQLKNAGGFSIIQNKMVLNSITELNSFYEGDVIGNQNIYAARWQRLDEFAMQLIILPKAPSALSDPLYQAYPHHETLFTRYDLPMLQQLYSFIRFEQSDLEINIVDESKYREMATSLIALIKKKYDMQNE